MKIAGKNEAKHQNGNGATMHFKQQVAEPWAQARALATRTGRLARQAGMQAICLLVFSLATCETTALAPAPAAALQQFENQPANQQKTSRQIKTGRRNEALEHRD